MEIYSSFHFLSFETIPDGWKKIMQAYDPCSSILVKEKERNKIRNLGTILEHWSQAASALCVVLSPALY
jgi:hypothetical protein